MLQEVPNSSNEGVQEDSCQSKRVIPLTIKDIAEQEKKDVHFMCFDFSHFSTRNKFLTLSSLIFVFYLTYGYVQEYIFSISGMKDKGWSVTAVQFLFYSLFSKIEMLLRGLHRKASISIYLLLSSVTLASMGFSNASLQYLNYPTQVIFKSCKLIPVLIGGTIIQGKKYGSMDYLAASVMCLGLVLFVSVDVRINPNFNFIGVAMILIALAADALLGNYQERTMKHFESSNAEMTFYTFSFGGLILISAHVLFGDIGGSIKHFNSNPVAIYGSIFIYSLSGYIGIQVVFSCIRCFGAFSTVLITSLRKAITIILSFILFGKPYSIEYLYSGTILFFGIYLNLLAKKGYDIQDIKTIFIKSFRNKISII